MPHDGAEPSFIRPRTAVVVNDRHPTNPFLTMVTGESDPYARSNADRGVRGNAFHGISERIQPRNRISAERSVPKKRRRIKGDAKVFSRGSEPATAFAHEMEARHGSNVLRRAGMTPPRWRIGRFATHDTTWPRNHKRSGTRIPITLARIATRNHGRVNRTTRSPHAAAVLAPRCVCVRKERDGNDEPAMKTRP